MVYGSFRKYNQKMSWQNNHSWYYVQKICFLFIIRFGKEDEGKHFPLIQAFLPTTDKEFGQVAITGYLKEPSKAVRHFILGLMARRTLGIKMASTPTLRPEKESSPRGKILLSCPSRLQCEVFEKLHFLPVQALTAHPPLYPGVCLPLLEVAIERPSPMIGRPLGQPMWVLHVKDGRHKIPDFPSL